MFDSFAFERNTYQCRIKALKNRVEALENGRALQKLRVEYEKIYAEMKKKLQAQGAELAGAYREIARVRDCFLEAMDDLVKEHEKEKNKLLNEIERLKKCLLEAQRQRDEAKDKLREKTKEYYAAATALEEEREKNRKLTAQVNRDFENSSIPSSLQVVRKKIPNSRTKTGRNPGAQMYHEGHGRRKHVPTEQHEIPVPEEYVDDPSYVETGRIIRKQRVFLHVSCRVVEYFTKEFLHKRSGHRVHAPFPEGYVNDVNYDGSLKAFVFMLANECNVSHEKIRQLLKETTHGEIEISDGMINGLCEEFSAKTETEQQDIFKALMTSPVMNVDFTTANVNGESAQVLICASPQTEAKLFIARENKGHKGIQGTIVENYNGILTHDHDTTFYSYGSGHQECAQHNIRYLIGSEQNEPDYTWNSQMHRLFQEMLHYKNSIPEGGGLDEAVVGEFEKRYDEILEKAREEYEDDPPSDYYREGYNLYLRLGKYKDSELLFLHDMRVPANNSVCERLARVYKRKQKQAMVIRSYESLDYLCQSLSVVYSLRPNAENIYEQITDIFNRKRSRPRKKSKKITEKNEVAAS